MNRVELVGRLTAKPELRYTNSNLAVTRFTVAVNRNFTSANGQREADFITCVAWRKQAENVCNYLNKGSLVAVEGRIQTGSYDDKDGKKVYTTEISAESVQFLETKGQSAGQSQGSSNNSGYNNNNSNNNNTNANSNSNGNVSPYDYQNNNKPKEQTQTKSVNLDNDPFADFGDSVSLDDADLD